MNAVASPISTNSTTSNSNRKIRRKNDSKTNSSQINKCNNEKRRRELENNYIEQLSEFLQLNKCVTTSTSKPDKAAILSQVVKTYREICDKSQQNRCFAVKRYHQQSSSLTSSSGSSSGSSLSTLSCLSTTGSAATLTTTTATSGGGLNFLASTTLSLTNTSSTNSLTASAASLSSIGVNGGNVTALTTSNSNNNNNSNSNSNQTTSICCSLCATRNCPVHPVQQGEVSSSESPLPQTTSILNGPEPEISAYFEALEHYISSVGWILLQVNVEGIIESCTRNIRELIGYEKQELYRTPLYKYLHPNDHSKIHPILRNLIKINNSFTINHNDQYNSENDKNSGDHNQNLGINTPPWSTDRSVDEDDHQQTFGYGSIALSATIKNNSITDSSRNSISTKVRMLVKNVSRNNNTNPIGTVSVASDLNQKFLLNNHQQQSEQQHQLQQQQQQQQQNLPSQDKYEDVILIAAAIKDDSDVASSVLCLITRPEEETSFDINLTQNIADQQNSICNQQQTNEHDDDQAVGEQMTFKLDIHGKILSLDASALCDIYQQYMRQWNGLQLQDMCHLQDLNILKAHLREVRESGATVSTQTSNNIPNLGNLNSGSLTKQQSASVYSAGIMGFGMNPPAITNIISKPFRLRIGGPDVYVQVKANSRLFLNQTPGESDFIMSVQTLLNVNENVLKSKTNNNNNNNSNNNINNNSNNNNTSSMDVNSLENGVLLTTGIPTISPTSPLGSALVTTLSMDSLVNSISVSSPGVGTNFAGGNLLCGLVGGGAVGGGSLPSSLNAQTTDVGGPLMTSAILNGTSSSSSGGGSSLMGSSHRMASTPSNGSMIGGLAMMNGNNPTGLGSFAASPSRHEGPSFYSNEFDFDLAHSSFDMDPAVSGWNDSRPSSRASVATPISTPRPSSTGQGFSPAICPSPSTPYQLSSHSTTSLPSPQSNTSQSATPINGNSAYGTFCLTMFENSSDKIDKDMLKSSTINNNNHKNANVNNINNMSSNSGKTLNSLSNGVNNSNNNSNNNSSQVMNDIVTAKNTNNSQQQQQHQQQQKQQQQQQLSSVHGILQPPPVTESERLRHLLMNKSQSSSMSSSISSALHLPDEEDKDQLLKFYKSHISNAALDENKDGILFKMSLNNNTNINMAGSARFPGGGNEDALKGIPNSSSTNSNNPMLLSLLKSEDDENGKLFSGGNRSSELNHIREDLHSGGHNTHGFTNNSNMSADDLRRMLKIQNDPATTRKRSMNDSDDNISAKRSEDRPSKLCENNKMLASLLKNPPKNITINTLPVVKTIPDIAPAAATLGRSSAVKSNTTSASMAFVMSSAVPPTLTTATATASATANINNCRLRGHKQSLQQQQHQHQHHQHQHHHQHHQQQQQLAESYLTLQQQQQSHIGGNILQSSTGSHRSMSINFPATLSSCSSASGVSSSASSVTSPTSNSENYIFTAPSSMLSTTSGVSTMTTSMGNPASSGSAASFEGDSELSKILDSVMDYVVDDQAFASSPPVLTQQQINERMAISAIKKSLMVETSVFGAPAAAGVGHNPTSQHVIHHSQQQEQQSLGHHHHHIQPQQQQQQQQHNPHASHHHHHQHHHSQSHPHQHSHHAHHQQQQHHHPLHHSHHTHSHSHGHQQQQPHHQHYGQHNPSQQPPAYPGNSISNMTPQQQQQQQMQLMRMQMLENIRMNSNQNFQRPPPNYPARGRAAATAGSGLPRVSGGVMGGNIGVGNQAGGINSSPSGNTSGGNNVSGSNVAANPNQYKYRTLAQQQLVAQQKERLLQQQQKQHMLVPENATARNDQLCLNPGLSNINNLLNTVAPNVSLSRTNLPLDSQLSSSFAQTMLLSPNQRNPNAGGNSNNIINSPVSNNNNSNNTNTANMSFARQSNNSNNNSPCGYGGGHSNYPNVGVQRFSNQVQESPSEQLSLIGTSNSSNTQLSPRTSNSFRSSLTSPSSAGRTHSLQQHNPMLSAQLQNSPSYNSATIVQHQHQQHQQQPQQHPHQRIPGLNISEDGNNSLSTMSLQHQGFGSSSSISGSIHSDDGFSMMTGRTYQPQRQIDMQENSLLRSPYLGVQISHIQQLQEHQQTGLDSGSPVPNIMPVTDCSGSTANMLTMTGNTTSSSIGAAGTVSMTALASNPRVNRRLFAGTGPISIACTAATFQSSSFGIITTAANATATATATTMISLCNPPQGPKLMANSTNTLVQQQQQSAVLSNQSKGVANSMVVPAPIDNSGISNTALTSNVEEPDLGFNFDNQNFFVPR